MPKPEKIEAAPPVAEKPKITKNGAPLIGQALDTMLRVAPHNDVIRTHVMVRCNKTIPNELQTYDEIVGWMEGLKSQGCEIDNPENPSRTAVQGRGAPLAIAAAGENPAIVRCVRCTKVEVGNCRYKKTKTGATNIAIRMDRFNHMIREAMQSEEIGWREFCRMLKKELVDKARTFVDEGNIAMDTQSEDHYDHDEDCDNNSDDDDVGTTCIVQDAMEISSQAEYVLRMSVPHLLEELRNRDNTR